MSKSTAPRRASSIAAEAAFRARVTELGGTVVGAYRTIHAPVEVICSQGHSCAPRPGNVREGRGLCRICAGMDSASAERRFRARVAELGGTVVGDYTTGHTAVEIRCPQGHLGTPQPVSLLRGQGICRTCARKDPATAERDFRQKVAEAGGVVLGPYQNSKTPVRIRCSQGHVTAQLPLHVARGTRCRHCAGKTWDALYIVQDPDYGTVKFGITSGDPRPRLQAHARDDLTAVHRLYTSLPGTVAPDVERHLIATLRDAGIAPVRGKEYFPAHALPVILDIVDHHPDLRERP